MRVNTIIYDRAEINKARTIKYKAQQEDQSSWRYSISGYYSALYRHAPKYRRTFIFIKRIN